MPRLGLFYDVLLKEIRIEFPTSHHAKSYHYVISCRAAARLEGCNVYVKMPQSVGKLEASLTYDGLIFHFDNTSEAAKWKDVLWYQVPGRSLQIYLKRDWLHGGDLCRALKLDQVRVVEQCAPDRAKASRVPDRADWSTNAGRRTIRHFRK
ncbi:hypothetical protein BBP40_011051 [Aspergillus hancockii]|nr:hypothetical protein BBP40_011051 [Aspergillus hancockii]